MELYTEAAIKAMASLGKVMAELAFFETLGKYLRSFTEEATSQNQRGWLLEPVSTELLAWGMLPPSGGSQRTVAGTVWKGEILALPVPAFRPPLPISSRRNY